jgi:hypothetical protein
VTIVSSAPNPFTTFTTIRTNEPVRGSRLPAGIDLHRLDAGGPAGRMVLIE